MNFRYLLIGAVAGLGLATAASAAETTLHATLTGSGGGSGTATVKVDEAKNQVCWDLTTKGLTDVVAAHIHKGAAGANGPPVVPFTKPENGASKGCATAKDGVAKDIVANPGDYYVNVHTKTAPAGAIRGQLGK